MHKAVRSKEFMMERITDIEDVCNEDWDELLPNDLNSKCYYSFPDQLEYLIQLQILRIKDICHILKISTKTYYKIIKKQNEDDDDEDEDHPCAGRPPNVNEKDEKALLEHIELQQCMGDCLCPRQARDWLETYIKEQGRDVTLDKRWWYRFKRKYQEEMSVTKIRSLESSRAQVSKVDIDDHFQKLDEKLRKSHYPQLIVNMDESGFIQRPNKNTTRNCICIKKCPVAPSFLDESDSNHISIVVGVTLSGQTLTPLLVSTTEKPPQEVINSPLGNKFHWFKTKRGYLNEEGMLFWLNNIYIPYINYMKSLIDDENAQPLLIFDGLKAHLTVKVNNLLESNGIDVLILPPHSSHLVQCLDLCFFGIMKKHYKLCRSQLFQKNNRKAQKIERILKSFYTASFPTIIFAGWKESGIDFTFVNGNISKISINKNRVIEKLINQ